MESEVTQVWGPSVIGRLLCFSPTWEINTQEKACQLYVNGRRQRMALSQFEDAKFTPGLFWTQIEIANSDGESFTLDGIPNLRANKLKIALGKSVAAIQHAAKIKWLIENFEEQIEPIKTWVIALRSAISDQLKRHGWLTTEFAKANEALKPDTLGNLLDAPEIKDYLNAHPEITRTHGLDTWGKPVSQVVAESNDAHLSNQLEAFKDFFDGVEKAPLTQEQRQAVICFDNRVLLVACAGSGKTSTMVAKVGYALLNRYLSPDRILLLAFNADAAAELRDRLDIRIICADKEDQIRDVVAIQLKRIADEYRAERTRPSVYVLGRYQKDRQFVPLDHFGLDVEFVTVHSAKGLEADHVFIPKMTSDILGFPSRVADDPVLRLAMPGGDDYPFAEERRLFYVALTRARKTVTLVTVSRKESLFITEMMKEYKVPLLKREGQVANASEICPKCKIGLLSKLNGKYGPFIGCTRFPRCDFRRSYSEKRPAL